MFSCSQFDLTVRHNKVKTTWLHVNWDNSKWIKFCGSQFSLLWPEIAQNYPTNFPLVFVFASLAVSWDSLRQYLSIFANFTDLIRTLCFHYIKDIKFISDAQCLIKLTINRNLLLLFKYFSIASDFVWNFMRVFAGLNAKKFAIIVTKLVCRIRTFWTFLYFVWLKIFCVDKMIFCQLFSLLM